MRCKREGEGKCAGGGSEASYVLGFLGDRSGVLEERVCWERK